jgi:hypothetical protein
MASGDAASGDLASGDEAPDDAASADVAPHDAAPDDTAPADEAPDDAFSNDASPDDGSPDDAASANAAPDEAAPDEAAPDDVAGVASAAARPLLVLKRNARMAVEAVRPTASAFLRCRSNEAITPRVSIEIQSMPASHIFTNASMTMPLSSTCSGRLKKLDFWIRIMNELSGWKPEVCGRRA